MTTVKQTIEEIDVVAFTDPVDKDEGTGTWPAGTTGTVVHDFGDHKMIEISDDHGVTLDLPVVPVEKLKLVTKYSKGTGADPPIMVCRPRKKPRKKPQRATAARSSVA
jgi:hypothetical protein